MVEPETQIKWQRTLSVQKTDMLEDTYFFYEVLDINCTQGNEFNLPR